MNVMLGLEGMGRRVLVQRARTASASNALTVHPVTARRMIPAFMTQTVLFRCRRACGIERAVGHRLSPAPSRHTCFDFPPERPPMVYPLDSGATYHYKLYIRLAAASARVHPTRFPCLSRRLARAKVVANAAFARCSARLIEAGVG
jgi:hypothetical protein